MEDAETQVEESARAAAKDFADSNIFELESEGEVRRREVRSESRRSGEH